MSLEFIERVFADFDAGRKALWTYEQMLLCTAAAQEELSPEEMATFDREIAPWDLFCSRHELSCWGTFFGPSFEGQKEDGTTFTSPRRSILDDAALHCWENRLSRVQHPVLRARYADAIWDMSKLLARSGSKPVSAAREAIDAYRTGARAGLTHQGYFDLDRALTLSIEINDVERISGCCEDLLALNDGAEQVAIGDWVAAGRAFLAHRKLEKTYLLRARAA